MTPYQISTILLTLTLLTITYLAAARWLQYRSAWLGPLVELDVVYILAGAPLKGERVGAVLTWARTYDCRPVTILVAADPTSGSCLSDEGAEISIAQWQVDRLRKTLVRGEMSREAAADFQGGHARPVDIVIVPGYYHGTDGEMRALAAFLETQPGLRRISLATSRSHIRRSLGRARAHIDRDRILGGLPAHHSRADYAPRLVLSEIVKLIRDKLGMTRAPGLHRGWWRG